MKHWIVILTVWTIRSVLFLILFTCRIRVYGIENFTSVESCIAVFWHNRMSMIPTLFYPFIKERNFTAVISRSRDGNILECFLKSYRVPGTNERAGTIRVAHNQKERAVREMISTAKEKKSVLMVTPDGPRGPLYKAKAGAIAVAKEAEKPLITFSWASTRFWELSSWDKFRIPKPFSSIILVVGKPLYFSPSSFLPEEEELKILQKALFQVDQQAKDLLPKAASLEESRSEN